MKITIAGAGDMGLHLAKLLCEEAQDIILIDRDSSVLDHASNQLDVSVVSGDSTSITILEEARAGDSDLFIAVTSSQLNNILSASLAKKMGAKKTIARIENNEFIFRRSSLDIRELGIDALYSPHLLAAKEIHRLLKSAELSEVFEFEQGKLSLIGLQLHENSPLIGKSVQDIGISNPEISFRPIAILRNQKTIIIKGTTVFEESDDVYFIIPSNQKSDIVSLVGQEKVEIKNVMIVGGGRVGRQTAKFLQNDYKVKLIEIDRKRCVDLAEDLSRVLVLNADGNNVEVLEEEGLDRMDAFIAVTGNSETNIVSSLVAKRHNTKKSIALVDNTDYISVSKEIGIDTLINTKIIAADNIFRYIRKGNIKDIITINGVDGEVIEYEVKPFSKVTLSIVKDLGLPSDCVIAGIIRGNQIFNPLGDFQIMEGDKTFVFARKKVIPQLEKLFN